MTAGRQVRGVIEGDSNPDAFIPTLIRLYQKGLFPFDKLVKFHCFEQINEALDDAQHGRVLKPIDRQ